MGCHFCHEELFAILMIVPILRSAIGWIRAKWHRIFIHHPVCKHDEHTCHPHLDVDIHGPPGAAIGNRMVTSDGHRFMIAEGEDMVVIGSNGKVTVQAVEVKRWPHHGGCYLGLIIRRECNGIA